MSRPAPAIVRAVPSHYVALVLLRSGRPRLTAAARRWLLWTWRLRVPPDPHRTERLQREAELR